MNYARLLAVAGAAINLGFLLGPNTGVDDRFTPASIAAVLFLSALTVGPYVWAGIEAHRRRGQRWQSEPFVVAMVASIVVAFVAYPAAIRQLSNPSGSDGIAFIFAPIVQAILVVMALAIADTIRARQRNADQPLPPDPATRISR